MPSDDELLKRLEHARKKKREAQASLKDVTELHVPKGARVELRKLTKRIKRLYVNWTDRIAVIRKKRDKKRGDVRDKIINWWRWACDNEPSIHYLQHRPYQPDPRKIPMSEDCSSTTTLSYKDAGAPDPNGYDYNGYGFTGTIRSHLPAIKFADVQRGDPIVYGSGSGSHVVVAAEDAKGKGDIQVYSHGQEAGPFLIAHSAEVRYQGGYFTCHRGVE